jgi:hypothetical protein
MAELNPLICAEDLRDMLSPTTFMQIFDDANTGVELTVMRSNIVTLVLNQAHAKCMSWLLTIYNRLPDGDDNEIPELLKGVELEYAVAFAWARHREYARASQVDVDKLFRRADETMERLQSATQRIPDNPPEAKPRNVGGTVISSGARVMCDNADGTVNSGDF